MINGTPCDETCEGFAHTYEKWNAKNEELEKKLPHWHRNPKYIEFFAKLDEEQEELEKMMDEEELKDYPEVLPQEMSPEEEEFCEQQAEELDQWYTMMCMHQLNYMAAQVINTTPVYLFNGEATQEKKQLAPSVAKLFEDWKYQPIRPKEYMLPSQIFLGIKPV